MSVNIISYVVLTALYNLRYSMETSPPESVSSLLCINFHKDCFQKKIVPVTDCVYLMTYDRFFKRLLDFVTNEPTNQQGITSSIVYTSATWNMNSLTGAFDQELFS